MPWDRDRLEAHELLALWDGFLWRQRRAGWMLAAAAQITGACWAGKDAPDANDTRDFVAFGGDEDDG